MGTVDISEKIKGETQKNMRRVTVKYQIAIIFFQRDCSLCAVTLFRISFYILEGTL